MRRPVWSFPSLLMSLSPLPPFVFASFSRFHRFRGRRRPGRGLLGRMRRHWILCFAAPPRGVGSLPGRRCPPCRRSRWSTKDGSTPGELVRPDSTRRGRVSSTLTPSDSWLTPGRTRAGPSGPGLPVRRQTRSEAHPFLSFFPSKNSFMYFGWVTTTPPGMATRYSLCYLPKHHIHFLL